MEEKYVLSIDLLDEIKENKNDKNIKEAENRKLIINNVFADFGVKAEVTDYSVGPTVTRFNVTYNQNVSMKMIANLVSDMQIRLGGIPVRFESTTLGKTTSGLEVANEYPNDVCFKELYQELPDADEHPLAFAFGKDVDNKVAWFDLDKAPHILISGTTGSGKSVFLNSLIVTLMMRNKPEDLKIMLFDPKFVEFSRYKNMPHLLCPIIRGNQEAKQYLDKLEEEMYHRYELFVDKGCSNVQEYNEDAIKYGFNKLPYIIVVIDEYADLVDFNKEVSYPLISLAQKARASGIHVIVATQRPATNVVTGVLKANLPLHMAFMTASMVDSLTILGEGGAEKLLGRGDMLVQHPYVSKLGVVRYQGCYISRNEITNVLNYLKENYQTIYSFDCSFVKEPVKEENKDEPINDPEEERYQKIKEWALKQEYVSISLIQRECAVGFNRASRAFLRLQKEGVVSETPDGRKGCLVIKPN